MTNKVFCDFCGLVIKDYADQAEAACGQVLHRHNCLSLHQHGCETCQEIAQDQEEEEDAEND